jgi:hypothetical protein
MKHFIMLMFAFTIWGTVGMLAGNSATDLVIDTMGSFLAFEFADWLGDKIMARCAARRAR